MLVHVKHVCERFPCGRLAKQFDKVSQTRCNYFIKQWNAIPPFSLQLSRRTKSYGCWFLLPHHATTSYNSLIHVVNFSRRLFSPICTRVFPFLSQPFQKYTPRLFRLVVYRLQIYKDTDIIHPINHHLAILFNALCVQSIFFQALFFFSSLGNNYRGLKQLSFWRKRKSRQNVMILFFTSKIGETDPLDRKETLEIDFDRLPFNKLIRYLRKKYMNNFFSQLIDNKNAVKNSRNVF